ncbi:MAG: hypothetical protein JWR10_898 [Rubritepida sp.]|nr:hypothetical protein [Rubritepida sp.]
MDHVASHTQLVPHLLEGGMDKAGGRFGRQRSLEGALGVPIGGELFHDE